MFHNQPVKTVNKPVFWYDSLSQSVTIGDRVQSRVTGKPGSLLAIDQRRFTVAWDGQGKKTYSIDLANDIRPLARS